MVTRLAAALLVSLAAGLPAAAQGLAPATVTPPRQTLPGGVAPEDYGRDSGAGLGSPSVAPDRPAPPAAGAAEAGIEPLDPALASLEVIVETPHADTHVEEMVLVRIRGVYTVTIALEEMKQPSLANFGWQQLGRDSWTSEFIDGRKRTVFERRLALYPARAGDLAIAPFVHVLTVNDAGGRQKRSVASAPATLHVEPVPAEARGWWMPASRLTYSDEWDRDTSQLASGEVARRTVTIEAVGLPAARLPPRPKMLAEWLITFAEPEERTQEITPEGPVSRVVWRWRMRPVSSEPGTLEAFHIPWYDTANRAIRDITLGSRRIALRGVLATDGDPTLAGRLVGQAPALAALGGFVLAGLVLLPGRRGLRREEWRRLAARLPLSPDRLRLAAAVRRGDAANARRIARRLAGEGRGGAGAAAALAELDAALFAREGPPLAGALDRVRRAFR